MKNIFKFTKREIMMFIMGMLVCSVVTIVIAESINSNEVLYDNSNSSSNSENVQDAIDGLYNIVDKVGSGFVLVANNTTGLSTELVADLYRYQGIQDANNNVDNYICFGTTNKSDCVGDTDKYMYRIIGINTSGQMKLIKKEALNTAYQWNSSRGVDWRNSSLYVGLNGSYFLDNTIYIPDSTWSNRIGMHDWYYGDIYELNVSASEIVESESNFTNFVSAKIGLLYLSDYVYGISGGNNCSSQGNYDSCKLSWINISNNDSNPPHRQYEWIIGRWNTNSSIMLTNNGLVSANPQTDNYNVRPVFFLNSNETIISGSGTITDPYILS